MIMMLVIMVFRIGVMGPLATEANVELLCGALETCLAATAAS